MSKYRDAPYFSFSSSAPAKRQKPMDRDEKIAYLEGEMEEKSATLSSTTKMINELSEHRLKLLMAPGTDQNVLKGFVEELARYERTVVRLSAEIAEHQAELKELNAASTSLSALPTGIYMLLLYWIMEFYIIWSITFLISLRNFRAAPG